MKAPKWTPNRPAVFLRDGLGMRVNRLNPDQVAELIISSVLFAAMIKAQPERALADFLSDEADTDPANVAGRWARAVNPFVALAVAGMPDVTQGEFAPG
jgi:hypothetical protein